MTLRGKNILITEDDTMNRVVYTMILNKVGAHVDFDRWGSDSIWKLEQRSYDLIILDLMLPHGESGYEIFKKIRQLPEYANVPIVAVSASEPGQAIKETRRLGFDGFIAKPIDKNIFPQQLEKLLEGETIWYAGSRY